MSNKLELESVVSKIQEGIASEESRGMILRTVTTALSVQLVSSMDKLQNQMNRLSAISDRLITRFEETSLPLIEQDAITPEKMFEYITVIQKNQAAIVDLYRKIVQSPNTLFPDNAMSDEEKKVIQLFKSFNTPEKRKKFLALCEEAMASDVESDE